MSPRQAGGINRQASLIPSYQLRETAHLLEANSMKIEFFPRKQSSWINQNSQLNKSTLICTYSFKDQVNYFTFFMPRIDSLMITIILGCSLPVSLQAGISTIILPFNLCFLMIFPMALSLFLKIETPLNTGKIQDVWMFETPCR